MDGKHFDALVRGFARSSGSRRRFLASGVAAIAAVIGWGSQADAAAKRAAGQICRKQADCASGNCLAKDATGRRYCGCASSSDCSGGTNCANAVCLNKRCSLQNVQNGATCDTGTPCIDNETCTAGVCGGGTPTICSPLDQCHVAGTCDSVSGICGAGAVVTHGTACSDGNPLCITGQCCTTNHQVLNGGCFEVITNPEDECSGVCDGLTRFFDGSGLNLCGLSTAITCATTSECPTGSGCVTLLNKCYTAC